MPEFYQRPGDTFDAVETRATGLVGSLAVRIRDTADVDVVARSTAGVTESPAGSGLYEKTLTAPTTPGTYWIVWDNVTTFSRYRLVVSGVLPQDALVVSSPNGVSFGDLTTRLMGLSALTTAEAHARLNQAYRELVADTLALKQKVELGPTVIGQADYTLDPGIIEIPRLRVNGVRYQRFSADEIEDVASWQSIAYGYGGAFAPDFSNAAAPQLLLWPTPATAGQAISARAAIQAPDMTDNAEYPRLPADFHEFLVDPGAFSVTLSRDDERFGDSQAKQAEWEQVKHKLRGRLARRVGSGPVRIAVVR